MKHQTSLRTGRLTTGLKTRDSNGGRLSKLGGGFSKQKAFSCFNFLCKGLCACVGVLLVGDSFLLQVCMQPLGVVEFHVHIHRGIVSDQ